MILNPSGKKKSRTGFVLLMLEQQSVLITIRRWERLKSVLHHEEKIGTSIISYLRQRPSSQIITAARGATSENSMSLLFHNT
uniref:Uncharacterized protein n=1 Tax=Candidatus Kentrum sp. LFY TaxID=2126342 RepID=A0A450X519_9GAMM|nr:MAG: hypothetical protein BECKLFY1418C_GA0070996_11762 [Candidatus Kentron sp. LFY]